MRIKKSLYVFSFIFILFTCLNISGFAQKKSKFQNGLASWYGAHFHGKKTTSGEVYNKHQMTAAHLSLPFGTKVKVTNQNTKKSVIVRINDRGPWGHKKRIIDLSEAAARKIGVYAVGLAEVTVEIILPGTAKAKLKAIAEKQRTIAKTKTATPVKSSEAAPTKSTALTFAVQGSVFAAPISGLQITEIMQTPVDFRQPLALKEEEMNGLWVHLATADQLATFAQPELYNPTLGSPASIGSAWSITTGAS